MNSDPTRCTQTIVFPPMPKTEDFGIENWDGAAEQGYLFTASSNVIFARQIREYKEAMAAWERVCMAIAGSMNRVG